MGQDLSPTASRDEVEARLAMPLAEAILTQRSVRRVLPEPVDDAIVLRCLELALEAPTASNGQNWEFVVVKEAAPKAALAAQYRRATRLFTRAAHTGRPDAQEARTMKSVIWQVDHLEEIPVLVVCCLRDRTGCRTPPGRRSWPPATTARSTQASRTSSWRPVPSAWAPLSSPCPYGRAPSPGAFWDCPCPSTRAAS